MIHMPQHSEQKEYEVFTRSMIINKANIIYKDVDVFSFKKT